MRSSPAPLAAERAPLLEPLLGIGATLLPFGLAVARAASSGQWRDDLPAVRDLGLVAIGVGGGLSTLASQVLSLLPLGSRTFRAALGSAIGLAIASHLLFGIAASLMRRAKPAAPRLTAALAAIATLTAALSPTWQREATVGGGAMLATAAALAALAVAIDARATMGVPSSSHVGPPALPARRWLLLGGLLGAAFAEAPLVGLVAAVACAVAFAAPHSLAWLSPAAAEAARAAPGAPPRRVLHLTLAACLGVAALLLAPMVVRPLAPHAFADLGRAVSASSLAAHDAATSHPTALGAWIREVGLVSLAIAAAGAVAALLRASTRPAVLALLAFVAADTLLPASSAGVLTADPLTALRSLSVAAIAVASALGVREAALRLVRSGVPLARAAAVLVVIFHLTLVALASEEAGFVADRSEQLAAEEWTDEAMAELEPDSAILVRSPALVWRLAAARMLRGERPDVVVIPVPLLARGRVAADLYERDRRLEPLLRAYALTGEPSEFALSKVADVHPLHVELDPEWTKRLVSHLVVDGMWLEFAPQPLGASDRKQAAAATLSPLRRVLTAVGSGAALDAPTAVVLAGTLRDHAAVLSTLGEHETAKTFLARVAELVPEDPAAATVFPLGLGAPTARAKQGARASRRR